MILKAGAEPPLLRLVSETLFPQGRAVISNPKPAGLFARTRIALTIVDVPFQRESGMELLRRVLIDCPWMAAFAASAKIVAKDLAGSLCR